MKLDLSEPHSVVVEYPADWYFDQTDYHIDRWVERYMKDYGIESTGSGMGCGIRDVSGQTFDLLGAYMFKKDISCYPNISVSIYGAEEDRAMNRNISP